MRVPNDELRKNLVCPRYNPYNRYDLLIAIATEPAGNATRVEDLMGKIAGRKSWELAMPSCGSSHRSQTLDAWAVPATPEGFVHGNQATGDRRLGLC